MSQLRNASPMWLATLTLAGLTLAPAPALHAQAPARASQLGTVKSINGNTVTIATAAGAPITVTIGDGAPVLILPPGSTDLKTATPSTIDQIAIGDRILATGKPGDTADVVLASRVILMKGSALAARNQAEQADWQKRGVGGIVKSVDGPVLVVSSGARTINIQTTEGTVFRRYASDSVKFEDSKPATLAEIHTGDQLTARGAHSADNSAVTAEEVVTGTFANLSGAISAVDPSAGTVTLKDLATKRSVTVKLTQNSDIRKLPAERAAMLARMTSPAAPGAAPAAGPPAGSPPPGAPGGYSGQRSGGGPGGPGGGPRNPGAMLSRMLASLPPSSITDLKPGDAVMIVASQSSGAASYTAITLLSGVEQLLSAPAGSQPITLSPWNLGAPEGGGMGGGPGGR